MKLLFDQNISHRILKHLPEIFTGSTSVKGEGLLNADDEEIWEYAKKKGYTIITQDSDFNDLNSLNGFPPKIVWVRTGNLSTKQLVDILVGRFSDIEGFINNSKYGCMEIVSFNK